MGDESFAWAIPEELNVPPDPLRCRLDFHHQAVVMTLFDSETVERRIVSARDVAHALAADLSFATGLLPANTLWWQNNREGSRFALYVEPKVRTIALQVADDTTPRRFKVPLPGFIFLLSPGRPPWVFAVKKKPTKETDIVYKAPLCNVFDNGLSCAGSHRYPTEVGDMVESFFISFFSRTGDLRGRSQRFPDSVIQLWEYLDNKATFPKADLVRHGTVEDLMKYE